MNYRQGLYLVILSSIFLYSCAGNQQLVADKQAKIDSLVALSTDLRQQMQNIDDLKKELDELKNEGSKQDAELRDALAKLAKIQDVQVEGNSTVIKNDLLFQSGSFQITSRGRRVLDDIWLVLEKHPQREILIVGHTDNLPIAENFVAAYRSNWDLSSWRALAVLHYLEGLPNAHPERLVVVARGPYQPITENDSDEGRRQNRRVEIILGEDI